MLASDVEDELFGMLNVAWAQKLATYDPALNPLPVIVWPGEAVPDPNSDITFGQPFFEVVTKGQKTLRRDPLSLFEATGLFTVSIFVPKSSATFLKVATQIGETLEAKFSKASNSGNIWFRDAKATKVPGTATQNQVNLTVTCTFQNEQ